MPPLIACVVVFVAMCVVDGAAAGSGDQDRGRFGPASSQYACGAGRIHDVHSVTETVTVRAAWRRPNGSADAIAPVPLETEHKRESFMLTVQFSGVFYTIRASADASWNLNPMTLGIDEPIGVCVNAAEMVLDRLDGSDFRGRVIGVGHDEAPFVPPGR